MGSALIVLGGVLQASGYAIAAMDLRRTRRRLRSAVPVGEWGRQTVDFARTSDSATSRLPTLDERVASLEQTVAAVAHRLQTFEDEAVARRLKDEAAAIEHARRPWLDFIERERVEWTSLGLFTLGVTASVVGALV